MLRNCVLPIVLTFMVTQAAQASNHTLLQIGQDRRSPAAYSFAEYQPELASFPSPTLTSTVKVPITGIQTQPQGQTAPSHPYRHTLRNLVIIFVAVGVMYVVLGAAAK